MNNRGFSLIEVMIAIAIMAVISLSIYQATKETFHLRDVLSTEGDFYNSIRMATGIIQRDISMLYSPVVALGPTPQPSGLPAPADARQMEVLMSGELSQTSQYWVGAIDKRGIRPSHFIGTDSKLSFISLSHQRIYKNSPESEFAKVSYELGTDPDNRETQVLVKSESPNAFELDDSKDKQNFRAYPLLHGIKKLSFRYWRKDKDQWSGSWDSDKEDTKNLYPDIIEMRVDVVGPQQLLFEGKYEFRPEVPLHGLDPST